jgi:hypothetical protein
MVLFPVLWFVPAVMAGEFDAITVASSITDGDTFETTSEGAIRLADIDAPEYYEYGYQDARDFLVSLIYGKTVYLDIDDIYGTGPYGRLICVVYVEHNTTHYINVNKALLVEDHAVIANYDNEFNPYTWALYVHKNEIPEFPSFIALTLFMITTLLAVILYRRKYSKSVIS